jgi:hypothetical protein
MRLRGSHKHQKNNKPKPCRVNSTPTPTSCRPKAVEEIHEQT